MKVLSCVEPFRFEYQNVPEPTAGHGKTVLKIRRIGICGTDLHAFEGSQPYFTYPRILGHELAAEVVDTDSPALKPGDPVTVIPYFNCGHCVACRHGKPNCCVQLKVFGVHMDGAMSEFVSVPTDKVIPSGGLSLDELAILEPLSIGAHGVRRAAIQQGESVLVVGAGPIGICAMTFAVLSGALVIAMDINKDRLAWCQTHLKPEAAVQAGPQALEEVASITHGEMPTVIIDATGSLKAIESSFQLLAHGGRYVLVGLQKGEIKFSHPEFHKREGTLMSSRNATVEDFHWSMEAVKKRTIRTTDFVTHRSAFENVIDNFGTWLNPENKVIKAMVEL